MNLIAELTL